MQTEAIKLGDWTDIVRRARLGRTVKAVAFYLATRANTNGTRVFPGLARVAWECEINYNTAQDAMKALREAGLIEVVNRARRRGDADEYRLCQPTDMRHVHVPTPAQADNAINAIRAAKQGRFEPKLHPVPMGAENTEDIDLHPTAQGAESASTDRPAPIRTGPKTGPAPIRTPNLHPAPLGPTTHYLDQTTNSHSDKELSTAVTLSRVGEDSRPARCPHGNNPRPKKGTTIPRCEHCRTETQPTATVEAIPTAPVVENMPVPFQTAPGRFTKTKCAEHGLPVANCILCRKGLPGKAAA